MRPGSREELEALCAQADGSVAKLYCEDIARIASHLAAAQHRAPARAEQTLRGFVAALAKKAQPCNSSAYAQLAYELQIIGLTQGVASLERRAREVAAHVRHHRDAAAAVDWLWVFITANVHEQQLFDALEALDLRAANADALAALACAWVTGPPASRGLGFAHRLAEALCAAVKQLPTATLARLGLALCELGTPFEGALDAVAAAALDRGLWRLLQEDVVDLAVACAAMPRERRGGGAGGPARLVAAAALEALHRAARGGGAAAGPGLLAPGSRVRTTRKIGPVVAGSVGVLAEFRLAVGRWRLFLEDGALPLDAGEADLELLQGGDLTSQGSSNCPRYGPTCGEDTHAAAGSCGSAPVVEDGMRGAASDLREGDGAVSARDAARLCCSFALLGHVPRSEELLEALCEVAAHARRRAFDVKPFEGETALSDPSCRSAEDGPEVPVLVLNLDRSPLRLLEMRREVQLRGIRARRFPAIDGRHRVVRRSSAQPYTRDLTDFALRWDEARPGLGVAMTADRERHYVGYVGSWLSHMHALRHGFEEGAPFVVILEDDQCLSPDFERVIKDIIEMAGDRLDVVILGTLDWRLRSLRYAQRRRLLRLRVPCGPASSGGGGGGGAGPTLEEEHVARLSEDNKVLAQERSYMLYAVGSRALGGEDYATTGCAGAWGYLVSRAGLQKMQSCMKFMWESFDDVLQAVLQGDSPFTSQVGRDRLWAVWPPLVTSDGRWPSQNSGDDLDAGRQAQPVSPHAGFRDPSLQTAAARLVLGPPCGPSDRSLWGSQPGAEALSRIAATALLWAPVESIWAYTVSSWRRLFDQRFGGGRGFELRTEMQLRLHSDRRFFEISTEGLTWSWTLVRAAFLFGLHKPAEIDCSLAPLEGPPVQLLPLAVRVLAGPGSALAWCPDAWFRDLCAVAPEVTITLVGQAASAALGTFPSDLAARLAAELPLASVQRARFGIAPSRGGGKESPPRTPAALAVAAALQVSRELLEELGQWLAAGWHIVVTAATLGAVLDVLNGLVEDGRSGGPRVVFAGLNPFGSCLPLDDSEGLRSCVAGGKAEPAAAAPQPWPPGPPPAECLLSPEELRSAARAQLRAEAYEPRVERLAASRPAAANGFWLGLEPP